MGINFIREKEYEEKMQREVLPCLARSRSRLTVEREKGCPVSVVCYDADAVSENGAARGVVVISHGFTETAEKYDEAVYYFLQHGYHVYLPEHCGHGYSYRLCKDASLVHVDSYERYLLDFLAVAGYAKKEHPGLPVMLFAHSMGGGIGAAAAAREPELFAKIVLTSPMIRPLTLGFPYPLAMAVAGLFCLLGKKGTLCGRA